MEEYELARWDVMMSTMRHELNIIPLDDSKSLGRIYHDRNDITFLHNPEFFLEVFL